MQDSCVDLLPQRDVKQSPPGRQRGQLGPILERIHHLSLPDPDRRGRGCW